MLLQIHDERVFEAPESGVEMLTEHLRQVMEHAVKLHVPLSVDIGVGNSWYDAKA